MIGIELGWLGWDMDITSRCARSKGLLNRNSYCSWSHLSQSDSEHWNEMRGREKWVWGGVEWGGGRCCCWWLFVFCIVPLCSLFFVSVPCGIDFSCLCEDYALRGSTVVFVLLSLSWCSWYCVISWWWIWSLLKPVEDIVLLTCLLNLGCHAEFILHRLCSLVLVHVVIN